MKIKYLLLGLFTPLLCGVSFANSFLDSLEDYVLTSGYIVFDTSRHGLYDFNNTTDNKNVCLFLSGEYFSNSITWAFTTSSGGSFNVPVRYPTSLLKDGVRENYGLSCSWGNKSFVSIQSNVANSSPYYYKLYDFGAFLNATNNNGGGSSDCSSIQSQLNTCSSALSGVSANLSSCQSDLASCSNSCDTLVNQCLNDKSILSGNLANCQENNSSLQNYNDSLISQLNECLASSGSFGSGANLIQFDIFRKDGNIDYSLPITNNLFLPYGYKGKLNEDRVLTISKNSSSEYSLSIDDLSFDNDVVAMLGKLFVFFMSLGLFCVFLYTIRRYFIGLKSIK